MKTLNISALVIVAALLLLLELRTRRLWGTYEAATEAQGEREARRYMRWIFSIWLVFTLIREFILNHK